MGCKVHGLSVGLEYIFEVASRAQRLPCMGIWAHRRGVLNEVVLQASLTQKPPLLPAGAARKLFGFPSFTYLTPSIKQLPL